MTKITTAALLLALLSGCASKAIEAPEPALREEPINSLALEQCAGANGQETCFADVGRSPYE